MGQVLTIPVVQQDSRESLRESLLALRHEHDALARAHAHNERLLQGLNALLEPGFADFGDGSATGGTSTRLFGALREVFAFSQALVLMETGVQQLACLMAEPLRLIGTDWPIGPLFAKVLAGKAVATFDNTNLPEWADAAEWQLDPQQPALYAPIRVRDQRGVLVLLRDVGEDGFDHHHVPLAQRFALLASHALAAQLASQDQANNERLRRISQQLRTSERIARHNAEKLTKIVNALPFGVMVQDKEGRVVMANPMAARLWGWPADNMVGYCPFDEIPSVVERELQRGKFLRHVGVGGTQYDDEHRVTLDGYSRTLSVMRRAVHLAGEKLMLSVAEDISTRKQHDAELSRALRRERELRSVMANRQAAAVVVGRAGFEPEVSDAPEGCDDAIPAVSREPIT